MDILERLRRIEQGDDVLIDAAAEIERLRDHLMMVLTILQDLHPDDRCRALDEAQEFYNKARPQQRVESDGAQYMRLVIVPRSCEQKEPNADSA